MKQAIEFEDVEKVDGVPVSPLLQVQRSSGYGSVPGLEDDELANPDELERQVMMQEFALVLDLPGSGKSNGVRASVDECGGVDWGAFGTVDFKQRAPELDKARYKAQKLREQLTHVTLLLEMVKQRVPGRAKFVVLKQLRMGVIELEHLANEDMRALGRLYLRCRRLRQEIAQLEKVSWRRQRTKARAWVEV